MQKFSQRNSSKTFPLRVILEIMTSRTLMFSRNISEPGKKMGFVRNEALFLSAASCQSFWRCSINKDEAFRETDLLAHSRGLESLSKWVNEQKVLVAKLIRQPARPSVFPTHPGPLPLVPEKELARQVFQTPLNIPKSLRSQNYSPQGSRFIFWKLVTGHHGWWNEVGIQATIVLFD